MSKHTIHVRSVQQRWVLEFHGVEYGGYVSKEDATSTAQAWAQNAAKHGHFVQVVIHSDGPAFNMLLAHPFGGGRNTHLN